MSNIELRSEKVRNIIGQIPSRIVRIGISVIFMVVLSLLAVAYFVKFTHSIDLKARLYHENNQIHYSIEVPQHQIKTIKKGQKLVISLSRQVNFSTSIQEIDTTLHVNKEHAYYLAHGLMSTASLQVDEAVIVDARIFTGKINTIDYILKR